MNSLLLLCQSLLEPILTDWLYDVDLCTLDTAVCNSGLRVYFLSILSMSTATTHKDNIHSITNNCYEWIYTRRMSLASVSLSKAQCLYPTLAIHYALSSKRVSYLDAPVCVEFVRLIQDCKLQLKTASLEFTNNLDTAVSVLQLLGNSIEKLIVHGRSLELGSTIAQYCPNLKEVISNMHDLLPVLMSCPIQSLSDFKLQSLVGQSVTEHCRVDIKLIHATNQMALDIRGKRYCINNLHLIQATQEEVNFLTPFLPHVEMLWLDSEWYLLQFVLSKCPLLTDLVIMNDIVEEEFLVSLSCLTQLSQLNLCGTGLTDLTVLSVARHCPQIICLEMSECIVSVEAQRELVRKCPLLQEISFHSIPEDLMIERAVDLVSLHFECETEFFTYRLDPKRKSLCYENVPLSCDIFIRYLNQNLLVTDVTIVGQDGLDNKSIETMVRLCPELTRIHIYDCKKVSSAGLYAIRDCKKLVKFRYSTSHKVNKLDLQRLLIPSIKILSLYQCVDLSFGSLSLIARLCPEIRELEVTSCPQITSKDVIVLLKDCTKLKTLNVQGCKKVTAEILRYIKSSQTLTLLEVQDTSIKKRELLGFLSASDISSRCEILHDF